MVSQKLQPLVHCKRDWRPADFFLYMSPSSPRDMHVNASATGNAAGAPEKLSKVSGPHHRGSCKISWRRWDLYSSSVAFALVCVFRNTLKKLSVTTHENKITFPGKANDVTFSLLLYPPLKKTAWRHNSVQIAVSVRSVMLSGAALIDMNMFCASPLFYHGCATRDGEVRNIVGFYKTSTKAKYLLFSTARQRPSQHAWNFTKPSLWQNFEGP
jgi:hypothetical protein